MESFLKRPLEWPSYLSKMLPIWLRSQPKFAALISVLSGPFRLLNQDLVDLRALLFNEYKGTGQRIVLERVLRDRLSNGMPKIWVVNGTEAREEYDLNLRTRPGVPVYGYSRAEIASGALTGIIYLRPEMYANTEPDFVVRVLSSHWATLNNQQRELLITLLERFKAYGTTYQIELI